MPLLNTKSLLQIFLRNLKHDRQFQYQEERSIAHNPVVFPGNHKTKNPTIIDYVYIMDHETISYKNLIQELSVQYNRLTLSYKNQQIHVPILCLQTTCLLCAIPAMEYLQMNSNSSFLGCTLLMGTSTMCVIA
jgi:hypothetical protein